MNNEHWFDEFTKERRKSTLIHMAREAFMCGFVVGAVVGFWIGVLAF